MPSTPDHVLDNFASYVKQHNICINPLISPHRFPGRGLGIRANSSIPPKTRLMHMPTNAIVKWSDIPADFMPCAPPPAKDGGIRVYSRLASWLAFSNNAKEKHGPWMATWPGLQDFEMWMPGLWPESCREFPSLEGREVNMNGSIRGAKRRKVQKTDGSPSQTFAILPPGITGHWATLPTSNHDNSRSTGILAPQQKKFESDLASAMEYFPELNDRSSTQNQKFLHAWCCVNTRCFSYWPTWPIRKAPNSRPVRPPPSPKDRDEAMAMCPGMDLFNHTSDEGDRLCCAVSYNKDGFTIMSPTVRVKEGEELFISYGAHSEEDLWVEYGFMLGGASNKWDGINIDAVVFSDSRMTGEMRMKLTDADYVGGYTLRRDGVCWRTETAARLLVMKPEAWDAFVEGTYAGDHDEAGEVLCKQAVDEIIRGWIRAVQCEAENSLRGVEALTAEKSLRVFNGVEGSNGKGTDELVDVRKEMCLVRWRQMLEICRDGLVAVDV
jgi:hypothetical protein